MRIFKFSSIILTFLFVLILVHTSLAVADGVIVPLQETSLYSGGVAAGFYVGIDGDLFIIDRQDELWMIDPETGNYRNWWGIGGVELMDVVQTQSNVVWWTISDTVFGNLNLETNAVQYWDLAYYFENLLNLGPLSYQDGSLWLAPYYAPNYGIFRFDLSTYELCLYQSPVYASDLIILDGMLWMTNWQNDSLMHMDPGTGRLVKFATGGDIHTIDSNLRTDGTQLLWTEDVLNGQIVSFDPDSLTMTAYDLPTDEQPRNLDLRGGKVWYTNASGSFGRLDPNTAGKASIIVAEQVVKTSMTPECITLDVPFTNIASREPDGTFTWTDINSTQTDPLTGVLSYSLLEGSEPYGIVGTLDYIWVTDPGRQKLIRMPISEQEAFITVIKEVINDNGGSALPDDFNLLLNGQPVTSGETISVDPGTYTVTETLLPGYTFEGFSGDCDQNGVLSLAAGESKTCIITNDDQPAEASAIYLPLILK
ncbi:MAG: hypothetical protein P1P73_10335 [Brevefilum sp.]|nr:hypothetical protein [Brevefilum sp.]